MAYNCYLHPRSLLVTQINIPPRYQVGSCNDQQLVSAGLFQRGEESQTCGWNHTSPTSTAENSEFGFFVACMLPLQTHQYIRSVLFIRHVWDWWATGLCSHPSRVLNISSASVTCLICLKAPVEQVLNSQLESISLYQYISQKPSFALKILYLSVLEAKKSPAFLIKTLFLLVLILIFRGWNWRHKQLVHPRRSCKEALTKKYLSPWESCDRCAVRKKDYHFRINVGL